MSAGPALLDADADASAAAGRPRISIVNRPAIRLVLALITCAFAVMWATRWVEAFEINPDPTLHPFTDAVTYLGAGERLNVGHALYALAPGDRPIFFPDDTGRVPLFSPPPIAAIWRPLAALPIGFTLWVAAAWASMLGTLFYLVFRIGVSAAILGVVLSFFIGQQLAVANVACFFPMAMVVCWRYRRRAEVGFIVGALTALKLTPGTLAGWIVGRRDWPMLGWAIGGGLAFVVIGAIGAGVGAYIDYLNSLRGISPSSWSVSAITGVPWMYQAVLVGGTFLAALLGRHERLSFIVAVLASVLGAPAMYIASLAPLIAILAPLLPEPDEMSGSVPIFGRELALPTGT